MRVSNVTCNPIEDATARRPTLSTIFRRRTSAEKHIESHPRITDHWQRFSWRRPTNRVRIDAGVVVRAPASLIEVLYAELHRRKWRPLPETLCVQLVHRGTSKDV